MIDFGHFNSSKFIWFTFNLRTLTFDKVSPSILNLLGCNIDNLNSAVKGQYKSELIEKDYLSIMLDIVKNLKDNTPIELPFPIKLHTAKNESLWFELELHVKNDELNQPYMLHGIGWNVSPYLTSNEKLSNDLKRHKEELSQSVFFNREVLRIKEEERRKIALEIHDELGQLLSALKLEITMLLKRVRTPSTKQSLQGMQTMATECIDTVRRLSSELHPSIIDHLGLFPAIEWLANNFSRRSKWETHLSLPKTDSFNFTPTEKIFIFRVVQEALNNIAKHAQAKIVNVSISTHNNILSIEIADDGVGFETKKSLQSHSLGLLGMRERINAIGGDIVIASEPLKGTRVQCKVPLKAKKQHGQ
jgi:signal transduction histidine kinase